MMNNIIKASTAGFPDYLEFQKLALQEILHDMAINRVERFFEAKLIDLSTNVSI